MEGIPVAPVISPSSIDNGNEARGSLQKGIYTWRCEKHSVEGNGEKYCFACSLEKKDRTCRSCGARVKKKWYDEYLRSMRPQLKLPLLCPECSSIYIKAQQRKAKEKYGKHSRV